jgi:hypothetical protein
MNKAALIVFSPIGAAYRLPPGAQSVLLPSAGQAQEFYELKSKL